MKRFSKVVPLLLVVILAAGAVSLGAGCLVAVTGHAAVVADSEPPPPQAEAYPAPRPGYVWVRGYWQWSGRWVWRAGHWERHRGEAWFWVDGHWTRRGNRYHWIDGRWEKRGHGGVKVRDHRGGGVEERDHRR